jgi:transposase
LALADGATYVEIMRSLRTTAPTISRWKRRFEQDGIAGLDPRHKGSQPGLATAQVRARIARRTGPLAEVGAELLFQAVAARAEKPSVVLPPTCHSPNGPK